MHIETYIYIYIHVLLVCVCVCDCTVQVVPVGCRKGQMERCHNSAGIAISLRWNCVESSTPCYSSCIPFSLCCLAGRAASGARAARAGGIWEDTFVTFPWRHSATEAGSIHPSTKRSMLTSWSSPATVRKKYLSRIVKASSLKTPTSQHIPTFLQKILLGMENMENIGKPIWYFWSSKHWICSAAQ